MTISESYDTAAWGLIHNGASTAVTIYSDEDEWRDYSQIHVDSVLHIEVRIVVLRSQLTA